MYYKLAATEESCRVFPPLVIRYNARQTEMLKCVSIHGYMYICIYKHLHDRDKTLLEKFWAGKQIACKLSVVHIELGAIPRGQVSCEWHNLSTLYCKFWNHVCSLKTSLDSHQSRKPGDLSVSQSCVNCFSVTLMGRWRSSPTDCPQPGSKAKAEPHVVLCSNISQISLSRLSALKQIYARFQLCSWPLTGLDVGMTPS